MNSICHAAITQARPLLISSRLKACNSRTFVTTWLNRSLIIGFSVQLPLSRSLDAKAATRCIVAMYRNHAYTSFAIIHISHLDKKPWRNFHTRGDRPRGVSFLNGSQSGSLAS